MIKFSPQLLSSLHLSEAQAAVYVAALELGVGSLQDLADKSKVKRTSIYNFLDELKQRGLIRESKKKKRKVYSAVHPEQLMEIEKTRLTELQHVLPELLAIHNRSPRKPRVTFYEGMDAIEEVYWGMLAHKQPIVAYGDLDHMLATMHKNFADNYPAERARRNIPFKWIVRDTPLAREYSRKYNIRHLRQAKFLACDELRTEINIYEDKVALMSFRVDPPLCVLIEDSDIAHTLRATWQELWDHLPGPLVG